MVVDCEKTHGFKTLILDPFVKILTLPSSQTKFFGSLDEIGQFRLNSPQLFLKNYSVSISNIKVTTDITEKHKRKTPGMAQVADSRTVQHI